MNLTQLWNKQRLFEQPDPANPGSATPPDYSFLPEEFQGGDDGPNITGFTEHYEAMAASHGRLASMMEGVPETPEDYQFEIPEIDYTEMGLPDDFALELKTDDEHLAPLIGELGTLLHQHNIPSEAAGAFIGLLAKYEATTQAVSTKAWESKQAEIRKELGPQAQQRISTAQRLVEARLPKIEAEGLAPAFSSVGGIKALERLLSPQNATPGDGPAPSPGGSTDWAKSYYGT